MKHNFYFCIYLLVLALFVGSCTDEEFLRDSGKVENANFTLEEAKTYFEKQMMSVSASRSLNEPQRKKGIAPGEFVPKWEGSVASVKLDLACYDIPIDASVRHKAMYATYENGKATANMVDVYQKLIVVKDIRTQQLGQYILTLIPDKGFYNKHKKDVANKFVNCADKGGFSGVAIYSKVQSKKIARVNRYRNGLKVNGVFLLDPKKNRSELSESCAYAKSLVKDISIASKMQVMTRMGEDWDDYWDDDDWYDDWDDDDWYDDWYDSGWDINGGSLGEIIITPEEEWNSGNEEWMEETRPGGIDWEEPDPDPDPDDDTSYESEPFTPSPDESEKPSEPEKKEPQEYVSKEGDKLANPNVVDPGTTQLLSMCTMESFAYIHQLQGSSADLNSVTLRCAQMFGVSVIEDGLTLEQFQQYVNTYFNTGEFSSYQDSVNSSEFTLTTIQGDYGADSSHSVVIVGYHSDGDVIYMDPMEPKLQEADPSYFGDHYNISVNSSK